MDRTDRRDWPVRIFRLGEEPSDDLTSCTTAAERLALVGELSASAWALTGRPMPGYKRSEIPVVVRRLR
jgi:hypothetical protein